MTALEVAVALSLDAYSIAYKGSHILFRGLPITLTCLLCGIEHEECFCSNEHEECLLGGMDRKAVLVVVHIREGGIRMHSPLCFATTFASLKGAVSFEVGLAIACGSIWFAGIALHDESVFASRIPLPT